MPTKSYIEAVSERIIDQLERGMAPWTKPWEAGERFMPYNPTTDKNYHGMNAVALLSVMDDRAYTDPRWMTYKQALGVDAQVNRGEKGATIQYWKWNEEVPVLDDSGHPKLDDQGHVIKELVRLQQPRVWSAIVFNGEQISGLPQLDRPGLSQWERQAEAEDIIDSSGANILYQQGDKAFYKPSSDLIVLPERHQFATMDKFYATALHELGHWSGHQSRLNRDLSHPFGSKGYAKEELRAEIASMMMGEQLSIGHDPSQHVAYIGSWIQLIKDDPSELFRAAADADKISNYLLHRQMKQHVQQEQELEVPVQLKLWPALPAVEIDSKEINRLQADANTKWLTRQGYLSDQEEQKQEKQCPGLGLGQVLSR